jgi:putative inorganic carbon (HCO3(-)) transporter
MLGLLLMPTRATVVALVVLPLFWGSTLRTPRLGGCAQNRVADLALAVLLVALLLSALPSFDLSLTLPKLCGSLAGVLAFRWISVRARSPVLARRLATGLVLVGVVVAAVGLVGTRWGANKLPLVGAVTDTLPSIGSYLPHSALERAPSGIHPNEVGGALATLLPLVCVLALRPAGGAWARRSTKASAALIAFVLILTQSRSALMGVAVAGLVGAFLALDRRSPARSRWRGVAAGALILLSVVVAFTLTGGPALSTLDEATGGAGSGVSRWEVWGRALYMLRDFPLTGIGLNTFGFVLNAMYPAFSVQPDQPLPHAHNFFLQVGLDLGLPGLAAVVALFGAALGAAWRAKDDPRVGPVATGCGLGLLAHAGYGLTDAIALGAKPSILVWVLLALALNADAARRAPT